MGVEIDEERKLRLEILVFKRCELKNKKEEAMAGFNLGEGRVSQLLLNLCNACSQVPAIPKKTEPYYFTCLSPQLHLVHCQIHSRILPMFIGPMRTNYA